MSTSDSQALGRMGLNPFLFAPVGDEANGMTLSVISLFARLGQDPWLEAARLSRLPAREATESLARSISVMPGSAWAVPASTEIAARLVMLLPESIGRPMPKPEAPNQAEAPQRNNRNIVVAICIVAVLALAVAQMVTWGPADSTAIGGFSEPTQTQGK